MDPYITTFKSESLEGFQEACKNLAIAFMEHKHKGEDDFFDEDFYTFGENREYFIGSEPDYGLFSDGSDYYHWTLPEMYTILSQDIPYDTATEHQDWSIGSEGKPEGWVNLEFYARRRAVNMELTPEQFWRKLQYEHYTDKAEKLTEESIRETERIVNEMKERWIKFRNQS